MGVAETVLDAFDSHRLIGSTSATDPSFDDDAAYAVALEIHRTRVARGEQPVGRKIGFTNRSIWPEYGVWAPIWGYIYDTTVHHAPGCEAHLTIGHLLQPRIEPEIQLHFARTPPVTRDEEAILSCVDWIGHGFEIVQSPYPDWKFTAADSIAACGLHGALVIGKPVPVVDIEDCVAKLRMFGITLSRDGGRRRAEVAPTCWTARCSPSRTLQSCSPGNPASRRSKRARSSRPEHSRHRNP